MRALNVAFHSMKSSGVGHSRGKRILLGFGASDVSKAESIRKFTILPTDFTIAGGQLTAKLSIKRHVVAQEFAKEISELFAK